MTSNRLPWLLLVVGCALLGQSVLRRGIWLGDGWLLMGLAAALLLIALGNGSAEPAAFQPAVRPRPWRDPLQTELGLGSLGLALSAAAVLSQNRLFNDGLILTDDRVVVPQPGKADHSLPSSGTIDLVAGVHRLVLRYDGFVNRGTRLLRWMPHGGVHEVAPLDVLRLPAS